MRLPFVQGIFLAFASSQRDFRGSQFMSPFTLGVKEEKPIFLPKKVSLRVDL